MGLDIVHVIPSNAEQPEYFTLDELSDSPDVISSFKDFFLQRIDEESGEIKPVLYYLELGYQRKGMKEEFYKDFVNDKLYFKRDDVEKAFHYLQADHIGSLEELSLNFRKNFIENFVEGRSIFYASW